MGNVFDPIAKAQALRNELLQDLKHIRALLKNKQMNVKEPSPLKTSATIMPQDNQVPETRTYYRSFFGFDPVASKIKIRTGEYKFEQFFPLKADIELERQGILIGARVEVREAPTRYFTSSRKNTSKSPATEIAPKINNRIVFKKGSQEQLVSCVHTAVCTLDATEAFIADENQLFELSRNSDNELVRLPPEEHFVSLRSYVEGIAALGIRNIIGASYYSEKINPETLPFGFNSAMQRQIIEALRKLAPTATQALVRDVLIELASTVPQDWFNSRLLLLDQIYNLKDIVLTDPAVFQAVDEAVSSSNLRKFAVKYPKTHAVIKKFIEKNDPHYTDYLKATDISFPSSLSFPLFIFKIAIIGNEGSGRNSLCRRLSMNFNDPLAKSLEYIGASFGFREFRYESGEAVRLLLCNFSGENRFQYLLSDYILGSAGALVCYDVTNRSSFEDVSKWIEILRQKNEQTPIVLVGCKSDAEENRQVVKEEEANRLASRLGCNRNIMTSARTGKNCEEIVRNFSDQLYQSIRNPR
ncbi:MAG: Ras family GTPase [Promethearchaeota archaeon CR_4]|nr:MAG: Ras family GTPase [Candidatus Lokiarchaeota archaeon CR_4]